MPDQGFSATQKKQLIEIVEKVVGTKLEPIQKELAKLGPMQKELTKLIPIQKDIRKIKSDQKLFLNHLDRRIIDIDKRVDKLEGKPVFN